MNTKFGWMVLGTLAMTAACGSAPTDPGAQSEGPAGATSLAGAAAAAGGPDTSALIGKAREAIQNATFISDPQDYGLVLILNNNGYCSGVLVTNYWVLTAGHCVLQNGFNFVFQETSKNSEATQAALAVQTAVSPTPGLDVGLIKLSAPFSIGSVTSGYHLNIYGGDFNAAVGAPLVCLGYGNSTTSESSSNDPNFGRPQGAVMGVSQLLSPWDYMAKPWNNDGQLMMPGDSGGPCYYALGFNGFLLLGIQNDLFLPDNNPADWYDSQARSDAFASWVNATAI
ncbi:MAG TPA: trypsin-like serine protease [Polyangiaceae bacterium]|jgi:hypothetical protein|nr:trypsin-like serine protease [Polyangiaceae bacterium]